VASNWYDALNGGQLHVQAYEASYNVEGNYSRVQVNVWIERTSGTGKYSNYTDNSWSDAVGGSTFQTGSGTYDLRGGGSQLLLSGQATVYHNADGSRVVAISGAFTDPHGNLGSGSAGGSLTLTTIPRATQPTVSPTSGNTDTNYAIGYAGAASGFTHDLYYSLDGGATYISLATALGQTGSYTWTPASSLLPNDTDVTAIVRLDTKSGATLIGTKTVSLPLHVPDTVVPTVSSVAWTDAQTSAPDIPTLMGGTGRYVQGWSKLKPTATAAGASGSTIVETDITQNGQVTTSGVAFGLPIALSGSVPFSATAKDSRNRSSAPLTGSVAVTAYTFPNLASLSVQRTSDAAGTLPDPTGTFLKITPTTSVSDLTFGGSQKNLLEYQIRIAPKSTGVFTTVQAWTSSGVSGVTWTAARVFGTYASSSEWIVEVSIRDVFGKNGYNTGSTIKVATLNIPSESVFMDWDEGQGIGLGQYRQGLGLLEVADGAGKGIYQGGHKVLDTTYSTTTDAALTPLVTGVSLGSTDNLNSLTTAGTYRQATAGSATLALNYPLAGVAGILAVQNGFGHVVQTYSTRVTSGKNRVFERYYNSGGPTWSDWVELTAQGSNVVAFAVALSSQSQSGTAHGAKIAYDRVELNKGSAWDTTNHKFVAPTTGLYEFTLSMTQGTPTVGGPIAILAKNGVAYPSGTSLASITSVSFDAIAIAYSSYVTATGVMLIEMTASDYVEAYLYNGNGTSLNINAYGNRFSGRLVEVY
jgi:hypothetical protein